MLMIVAGRFRSSKKFILKIIYAGEDLASVHRELARRVKKIVDDHRRIHRRQEFVDKKECNQMFQKISIKRARGPLTMIITTWRWESLEEAEKSVDDRRRFRRRQEFDKKE